MIDPLISLAFSIYSAKGVYALLLGSGLSRSACIPTGWEITLELVKKLAALSGQDFGVDEAAWYRLTYQKEPDYSDLLEQVARMSGDRHFVLRPYFEPTTEEIEQGKKVPTDAHKAIAQLVLKGYIRVIVTTNFDQLMERALAAVGVTPSVIASADQASGMVPLAHSRCTLIKLHGDYTDTRIKNTVGELAAYESRINQLLDQILDEYGLIVCGWSGEWDEALRAAIERCPNRRFTTYWSAFQQVAGRAKQLCELRNAQIVTGLNADRFFGQLAEKITALEVIDTPRHPLTKQMAIALVKRYLVDERHRIQLSDLVLNEANRVQQAMLSDKFPRSFQYQTYQQIATRITLYESEIDTLLEMMITGCYWGTGSQSLIWVSCLERIARPSELLDGDSNLLGLSLHPARLILYACGIAALAAGRHDTLVALLTRGRTTNLGEVCGLWWKIGDEGKNDFLTNTLLEFQGIKQYQRTATSYYISGELYPYFKNYTSGVKSFDTFRDRFEYFAALIYADDYMKQSSKYSNVWAPVGMFARKFQSISTEVSSEIERYGEKFPLLQAGAFDQNLSRLVEVKTEFDNWLSQFAGGLGYY